MKTIFKVLLGISLLGIVILLWITRAKPQITIDFDAFTKGEYLIYEALHADGSKMSIDEAREIIRKKQRHTIILSEDDGSDFEDRAIGYKKSFFDLKLLCAFEYCGSFLITCVCFIFIKKFDIVSRH